MIHIVDFFDIDLSQRRGGEAMRKQKRFRRMEQLEPRWLLAGDSSMYLQDVDGDQDLDAIVFQTQDRITQWYENTDGQGTWSGPRDFAELASAQLIEVSDPDRDGLVDLVVERGDRRLAWYEFSDGDVELVHAVPAFSPGGSIATLSDFDQDGRVDFIIIDNRAQYVHFNRGDQWEFSVSEELPHYYGWPWRMGQTVIHEDLNGDGTAELAFNVISISDEFTSDSMFVLEGYDPSTAAWSDSFSHDGDSYSYPIFLETTWTASADLDGDGDLEALSQIDEVMVIANDQPTGGFESRTVASVDLTSTPAIFIDINQDGLVDWLQSDLTWRKNVGDFQFLPPARLIDQPPAYDSSQVGDIDGDGHLDLVVNQAGSMTNYLDVSSPAMATASIAVELNYDRNANDALDQGEQRIPEGVQLYIDVDGNGTYDPGEPLAIRDATGIGNRFTFQVVPGSYTIGAITPVGLAVSDRGQLPTIEGWSWEGVITSGSLVVNDVMVRTAFAPKLTVEPFSRELFWDAIDVVDFDSDGLDDLLVISQNSKFGWYRQSANRDWPFDNFREIAHINRGEVFAMDVNRDGTQDVVHVDWTDSNWRPNLGNGSFGDPEPLFADSVPLQHVHDVFDFDGDGRQDLLVTYEEDDQVYLALFSQSSDGGFELARVIDQQPDDSPSSQALFLDATSADLDGDGDLDVVHTRSFDMYDGEGYLHQLITAINHGDRFELNEISEVYIGSCCRRPILQIEVADWDLDNDVDIAFADNRRDFVDLFTNDGSGDFRLSRQVDTVDGWRKGIASFDIDQDGSEDLYIGNERWLRADSDLGLAFGLADDLNHTMVTPIDLYGDGIVDFVGQDIDYRGEFEVTRLYRNLTEPIHPRGDFNGDGSVGVSDIEHLAAAIAEQPTANYDLDGSGQTDRDDLDYFICEVVHSEIGDVNFDGVFNSSDLVKLFQLGHYEDGIRENSSWSTGDFNGDLEFNTSDLVKLFQGK